MGDEFHAEHLARDFLCFIGTAGEFHAAAFAAAAGMNLCLHYDEIAAELFCRVISLFRRARHDPARHRHTESF